MKIINILSLLLYLGHLSCIHGQIEPPQIQYNIAPNWIYISQDTNVVIDPADAASSVYTRRYPTLMTHDDDFVYFTENNFGPLSWAGIDGFLLHCIDKATGVPRWIHHNNHYSGRQKIESTQGSLLYRNETGDITLVNGINRDSTQYTFPYFFFRAHTIERTFDRFNGAILHEVQTPDSLYDAFVGFGLGLVRIYRTAGGGYTYIYSSTINMENGEQENAIFLEKIPSDMALDTLIDHKISYQYGDPSDFEVQGHFPFPHLYRQLNDSILVVVTGDYDNEDFNQSPVESYLIYYDISDLNNVIETRRVDISGDYLRPNPFLEDIKLEVVDETIIISQRRVVTNNSDPDNQTSTWLSWYDKNGEKLAYLSNLQGMTKSYSGLRAIMTLDEQLIVSMSYITPTLGVMGYDFISIPRYSENTFKICGSFSMDYTPDYTISIPFLVGPISEDALFLGHQISQPIGNYWTNFNYYYSLPFEDIGITTSTEDITFDPIEATISPNPAQEAINLSLLHPKEIQYSIWRADGVLMVHQPPQDITSLTIDISMFPPQQYFIQIQDCQSGLIKVLPFIKI